MYHHPLEIAFNRSSTILDNELVDISILVDAVEKLGTTVYKDLSFINANDKKHVIAVLGAGNVDKLYIPEIKKLIKG